MSQHASTANHDERDDQRKSHTRITDARCVLARVHLIRVLIIVVIQKTHIGWTRIQGIITKFEAKSSKVFAIVL